MIIHQRSDLEWQCLKKRLSSTLFCPKSFRENLLHFISIFQSVKVLVLKKYYKLSPSYLYLAFFLQLTELPTSPLKYSLAASSVLFFHEEYSWLHWHSIMLRYIANYSQHVYLLIIAIYHECIRFTNDFLNYFFVLRVLLFLKLLNNLLVWK